MTLNNLSAIDKDLRKCPGCGQCRFVCPVFAEIGDESSVARGRISLAKAAQKGNLAPEKELAERMSECLLCMACVEECPSQVKVTEIVLAARADIAKEVGAGTFQQLTAQLLGHSHEGWLAGLAPLAGIAERLAAGGIPEQAALRLRFGLGPFPAGQVLPRLAGRPLLRRLPEKFAAVGEKRGTVAYFVGCMDNYTDVQVGMDTIRVLTAAGFDVLLPKSQACCGLPMRAYGLEEDALPLMQRNLDALLNSGADFVVTTCGSCGGTLRKSYAAFAERTGNELLAKKAAELAAKTKDVTEVLAESGWKPKLETICAKVTYHDPCHLAREQGVRSQPRELIKSIPGIELVEMKNADRCCGGAGSFGFTHRELSVRVNSKKIDAIESTGADIVVTGCPSCKLYITAGLNKRGLTTRVVHTIELLAEAISG